MAIQARETSAMMCSTMAPRIGPHTLQAPPIIATARTVPPSATQTSAQVTALFVLGALPAALVLGLTYQSTAAPSGEEQGASALLTQEPGARAPPT